MKPPPTRVVTHHLIGPVHQVANVVTTARLNGRLVSHGAPYRVNPTLVGIDLTLVEPIPRRELRRALYRRILRTSLKVGAWIAGLAAVTAAGWGVWLLLVWADAHRWQLLGFGIVAFFVIGAIGAMATSDRGGCR